jgi:hypothetical protein
MVKIILPESGPKPSYYSSYVGYVKKILEYNNIPYSLEGNAVFNSFIMKVDDIDTVVDFSNYHKYRKDCDKYKACFKFQYSKKEHGHIKNMYSFTKISFYDWNKFYVLRNEIKYTCNGETVFNMQRPRANAVERRNFVQNMLRERYKDEVVTSFVENQESYWKTINNCLVHVFVPGARNDILDRGQIQCMAFGCCTISPPISDCVAYNKELIPGVHYIQCKEDYSDLVGQIEWCKSNRQKCIEIGNNAKNLFEETSTPHRLWKWVVDCLKE